MIITAYTDSSINTWKLPNKVSTCGVMVSQVLNVKILEVSCLHYDRTNNYGELAGVLTLMRLFLRHFDPRTNSITIHSDSEYVIKGINDYLASWIRADRNLDGVKNRELWLQVYPLSLVPCFKFVWVRGHDGNEWNEYCDEKAYTLATGKSRKKKKASK